MLQDALGSYTGCRCRVFAQSNPPVERPATGAGRKKPGKKLRPRKCLTRDAKSTDNGRQSMHFRQLHPQGTSMTRRSPATNVWLVAMALAMLCSWASPVAAQVSGLGPLDAPSGYNAPAPEITGPSVVPSQKAGVEVGQYAPDFKLEPIQPYPILEQWLGGKAPQSAEDLVPLSQLVGKVPVVLLFGSYT